MAPEYAANQAVLGVFVGVFAYSLVVLRTIRGGEDGVFVPALAVLVALLLALLAIGFLIFFIHHIAASIQATSIIETTARETLHAIDRLFPADVGVAVAEVAGEPLRDQLPAQWTPIAAASTGYIQRVDTDALFDIAREHDVTLRMDCHIGEFVIEGSPLASVSLYCLPEGLAKRANAAYSLGKRRTVTQDAAFGIRQLVDVALKALSPGINDTTTAITCIDFLGAVLVRLASRSIEAPYRFEGTQLRLVTVGPTFEGLLRASFEQIRQNAENNLAVLARLLEVLEVLAHRTTDTGRHAAMFMQAQWIAEAAERGILAPQDRAAIHAAAARVQGAIRAAA